MLYAWEMEGTAHSGSLPPPPPEAGHRALQSQTFTRSSITLSNPGTRGDQDLHIILLPHLPHKPKTHPSSIPCTATP
ncbi:hypothetical protein NQZ68_005469 [Dissostichus eleginoides]|nr:hypothetical protein NQZ68_005469 [Dissostichus eleginoides]